MKISTKGQYALQMMLDLAIHDNGENITIKSIAKRQHLSEKYLEQIVNVLSRANYVKSIRGAKGGYRLALRPEEYTIGMILRVIEGSLAPIPCIEEEREDCGGMEGCLLCSVWKQINDAINGVIDHMTLEDLVKQYESNVGYQYSI